MVLVWSLAGRAMAFAFGKQVARTSPSASLAGASTFQFHVLPASLSDLSDQRPCLPKLRKRGRRYGDKRGHALLAECRRESLVPATGAGLDSRLTVNSHNHIRKYCDASEERTAAIRFESPD